MFLYQFIKYLSRFSPLNVRRLNIKNNVKELSDIKKQTWGIQKRNVRKMKTTRKQIEWIKNNTKEKKIR